MVVQPEIFEVSGAAGVVKTLQAWFGLLGRVMLQEDVDELTKLFSERDATATEDDIAQRRFDVLCCVFRALAPTQSLQAEGRSEHDHASGEWFEDVPTDDGGPEFTLSRERADRDGDPDLYIVISVRKASAVVQLSREYTNNGALDAFSKTNFRGAQVLRRNKCRAESTQEFWDGD